MSQCHKAYVGGNGLTYNIAIAYSNKEFLCVTHTVEHNYISPSSTVGIQFLLYY